MRKIGLIGLSCVVVLLMGCGGSSEYSYESSGSSVASEGYRSYDSSQSYNTSGRSSAPFGSYPVNHNATCTTTCADGSCRAVSK